MESHTGYSCGQLLQAPRHLNICMDSSLGPPHQTQPVITGCLHCILAQNKTGRLHRKLTKWCKVLIHQHHSCDSDCEELFVFQLLDMDDGWLIWVVIVLLDWSSSLFCQFNRCHPAGYNSCLLNCDSISSNPPDIPDCLEQSHTPLFSMHWMNFTHQ